MPQYEKKSATNGNLTMDGQGTASIPVRVISGIVGDTYKFVRGDDMVIVIENYLSKTGAQVDEEAITQINAFVQSKYPNT